MKTFGYCRISRPTQNIERQERNILARYPDAIIVREIFTGTMFQGRKELDKIIRLAEPGDRIVFDSVSRMAAAPMRVVKNMKNYSRKDLYLNS